MVIFLKEAIERLDKTLDRMDEKLDCVIDRWNAMIDQIQKDDIKVALRSKIMFVSFTILAVLTGIYLVKSSSIIW